MRFIVSYLLASSPCSVFVAPLQSIEFTIPGKQSIAIFHPPCYDCPNGNQETGIRKEKANIGSYLS